MQFFPILLAKKLLVLSSGIEAVNKQQFSCPATNCELDWGLECATAEPLKSILCSFGFLVVGHCLADK